MQRRSPVARVFNGVPSSARTSSSPNATPAPPVLDDRAALIAFAWNIRDMVSSNMSTFEAFTPNQMKEFAANMANAFEKFTLELEAITQERDEIVLRLSLACYLLRFPTCDKAFLQRRDLDESMLLLRDREQVALKLSSALAAAHAVRCHEYQAHEHHECTRAHAHTCTHCFLAFSAPLMVVSTHAFLQNIETHIHSLQLQLRTLSTVMHSCRLLVSCATFTIFH